MAICELSVKMSGTVKKFSGYGRQLGYPTANIAVDTELNDGVYFGYADLDNYYNHPALIFIGIPTTVGDKDRRVEAHLIDIDDRDYYGRKLNLNICHFYRPNRKFGSIELLKRAMKTDESVARKWFIY